MGIKRNFKGVEIRNNEKELHASALKKASYALCIIGSLCAPFFLIYTQPDFSLGNLISHFKDYVIGLMLPFILGALPFIALAGVTQNSSSEKFTMFYFVITLGVVIYGYFAYIEMYLIKESNGAGFLVILMPITQMAPVIVALIISFFEGRIEAHQDNEIE
ncbi:hypothetical protein ACFL4M_00810 [Pseudomonadota bacterium]